MILCCLNQIKGTILAALVILVMQWCPNAKAVVYFILSAPLNKLIWSELLVYEDMPDNRGVVLSCEILESSFELILIKIQ